MSESFSNCELSRLVSDLSASELRALAHVYSRWAGELLQAAHALEKSRLPEEQEGWSPLQRPESFPILHRNRCQ